MIGVTLLVAIVVIIPLGVALFGFAGGVLAIPVSAIAVPFAYILILIRSGMWSATGAGKPVLLISGGEVRGRLRPVYANQVRSANSGDPAWWDFQLPAAQLVSVRVARSERSIRHLTLALELPPLTRDKLLKSPELRGIADRLNHEIGTPAAWVVGMMYPPGRRSAAVRGLVRALREAGAPVDGSGQ